MIFSKEFPENLALSWRNFLTRTGAKVVYWPIPDLENNDHDNIGELCPMKDILCNGKFKIFDLIFRS